MGRADRHIPYQLIAPALLLELALVLTPLAIGFYYSLHDIRFFQVRAFVGWNNYWRVIQSESVGEVLIVTAIFAFASLFLTFVIGFALALHLKKDSRSAMFMRSVALVPYIISMLIGSMLLKWMFSQESGLLPLVLGAAGLGDTSILASPRGAMAALVFNAMWRDSAFAMILLLAGLKSIPLQLFDAARIDGAGALYRFRRLTLPLMRTPILITLVRLFIHFVNVLTMPLILTGGGPGNATQTFGPYMYRLGFQDHILGPANALAIMMFAVNLGLIAILLGLFRRSRAF